MILPSSMATAASSPLITDVNMRQMMAPIISKVHQNQNTVKHAASRHKTSIMLYALYALKVIC